MINNWIDIFYNLIFISRVPSNLLMRSIYQCDIFYRTAILHLFVNVNIQQKDALFKTSVFYAANSLKMRHTIYFVNGKQSTKPYMRRK